MLAVLGGGVADVGERPGPGDGREHGDRQRVGGREQARGRRSRAAWPSVPSRTAGRAVPGPARVCVVTAGPGRRGRPGDRRVFHAWLPPDLNARAGGHRAANGESGGARPGRAGAELPPLHKSGLRARFSLSARNQGREGQGCTAVTEAWCPGVDHRCT